MEEAKFYAIRAGSNCAAAIRITNLFMAKFLCTLIAPNFCTCVQLRT